MKIFINESVWWKASSPFEQRPAQDIVNETEDVGHLLCDLQPDDLALKSYAHIEDSFGDGGPLMSCLPEYRAEWLTRRIMKR